MSERNGTSYESLLERIETAKNDIDGLRYLPGIKTQVRRSGLSDEEKIDLEEMIDEATKKLYVLNENPEEEFPTVDFDSNITFESTPSFQSLNTDNAPYPIFLRDIILPRFFPMREQEIQHPIMACVCLLNAAYIPQASKKNPTECELPRIYLLGKPQSGKSEFGKFVGHHYFPGRHVQVLGNSSGKDVRNIIDRACCPKDNDSIVPSNVYFDNFDPAYLDNQWSIIREAFIAVMRSQSYSSVATVKKEESIKFRNWTLYTMSSIKPIEVVARTSEELARRIITLLFEQNFDADSVGNYDWSALPKTYKDLWNKTFIEKVFLPNLGKLLSIKSVEGEFPNDKLGRSKALIATGVSFGVWDSVDEALEHLTEYWKFIESNQSSSSNALLLVVDNYLSTLTAYPDKSPFGGALTATYQYKVYLKDIIKEVCEKLQRARGEKLEREIIDLMITRGYILDNLLGEICLIKIER